MVTDRQARLVILVVEGARASYAELVELLGPGDLELTTSVAEARERLETTNPIAMLLTLPIEEAAALVEDVRTGTFERPGLPIVAVTDDDAERATDLGIDETVPMPVSGPALEAAVERAALLGRYKSAVNEFFDACRDSATGSDTARGSLAARRTADACLEEIQKRDDPLSIERLLSGI